MMMHSMKLKLFTNYIKWENRAYRTDIRPTNLQNSAFGLRYGLEAISISKKISNKGECAILSFLQNDIRNIPQLHRFLRRSLLKWNNPPNGVFDFDL